MKTILFLVILILSLLLSCNEPTGGGDDEPGVYIKVVDSVSGQPINGAFAKIYYLLSEIPFDSNYNCINFPNPFNNLTTFQYYIKNRDSVLILIIEQERNIIIDTLINEVQLAGTYNLVWPVYDPVIYLNEGFYTLKIITKDYEDSYEALYLRSNILGIEYPGKQTPAKVITNINEGKFVLKSEDMPYIGRQIRKIHESGVIFSNFRIQDSVLVEIQCEGFKITEQILELKKGKKSDVTIRLVK
ncbi:MAG: hypothetical protein EPN82_11220 [Bacteroidetes bacterium]|nr:MAG: hypothetical protein EPN82_11220 [Bacteroidota bacterium]